MSASGDPDFIDWWGSPNLKLDEDSKTIQALCRTLGVSRVITVLPSAMDVSVKRQQGLGTAAGYISKGVTNLISKESKNIAISVTAAAWGSQTGRCVWEASLKANQQTKTSYGVMTNLGYIHTKSTRSAEMLPGVLYDAIQATFGEFFQRDRAIYGSLGIDIPMSPVTGAISKSKKGKFEGIRLTWDASTDPRVISYAIYRALGDDLFLPYPSNTTHEPVFLDKKVDAKCAEAFRYIVVPVTRDGIEGHSSEPCSVLITPDDAQD